jgi:hypothetical protein
MIITAKFASTCPCCAKPIAVGSKINWSKGTKASHVECGSAPANATTREPLSVDGRPAIRAQHWSQRGHGPAVRLCAGGCGRHVGPRYAECYSCHQESLEAM